MASGGHGVDCTPVLSTDRAPQHHWFKVVCRGSASGGKHLLLRLYAVLKQALGFYYQSLQQPGADSWRCYCEEEESSHLLCDSPCPPVRLPGVLIQQCSLHHVIRSRLGCPRLLTPAFGSYGFLTVYFPVHA